MNPGTGVRRAQGVRRARNMAGTGHARHVLYVMTARTTRAWAGLGRDGQARAGCERVACCDARARASPHCARAMSESSQRALSVLSVSGVGM